MSRKAQRWLTISAIVLVMIVVGIFTRVEMPPVSVAPEPLFHLDLAGIDLAITNSIVAGWITMIVLILGGLYLRSSLKMVPTGLQNVVEMILEFWNNLTEELGGEKNVWKIFPLVTTIFLFVMLSNFLDLLTPLFMGIGPLHGEGEHQAIIPILRAPSSDLSMTVALALISVALTQIYGIQELGLWGYFSKFIRLEGWVVVFRSLTGRVKTGLGSALFMAFLDTLIGVIELFSEIFKIVSFSFRLFGNVFAGELLLIIFPSIFFPTLVVLPFMFFELLIVTPIQAFIFAVLTLAFMNVAMAHHGSLAAEGGH